ncbi:hypothetical protein DFH08DRAFT_448675 [Mycena albidolilacea]|uniref:Uncharacterized protein n=1 Tax=Mycena albidolilacea TaxID=1033008 RepID=A0AAD6Z8C6_9AGAR|nr:hypothetical protein DFH08DRAFT_448675 [Mycena albidolilacea]
MHRVGCVREHYLEKVLHCPNLFIRPWFAVLLLIHTDSLPPNLSLSSFQQWFSGPTSPTATIRTATSVGLVANSSLSTVSRPRLSRLWGSSVYADATESNILILGPHRPLHRLLRLARRHLLHLGQLRAHRRCLLLLRLPDCESKGRRDRSTNSPLIRRPKSTSSRGRSLLRALRSASTPPADARRKAVSNAPRREAPFPLAQRSSRQWSSSLSS